MKKIYYNTDDNNTGPGKNNIPACILIHKLMYIVVEMILP
jgi:hypothetical protein